MSDDHMIRLECLKLAWPRDIANPDLVTVTKRAEALLAWVMAADTSQEPAKTTTPRKRSAKDRIPA